MAISGMEGGVEPSVALCLLHTLSLPLCPEAPYNFKGFLLGPAEAVTPVLPS